MSLEPQQNNIPITLEVKVPREPKAAYPSPTDVIFIFEKDEFGISTKIKSFGMDNQSEQYISHGKITPTFLREMAIQLEKFQDTK
jgi:hypothetical protein